MKGFYVPGSQSSSYVASKRNEEGSFAYDAAAIGAGIQKQAALQDLSKQYESTIENAYASYLATQRGIDTSAMGQGYKEAYKEKQQQNLISNIAEANQNVATVRAQIENRASQSREALDKQFKTETANLDRVAATMNDYLTYVKGLSGSYLEDKPVDELYEALYNYQPQGFTDEEGQAGLPYSEWIKNQLKDTADDKAWSQWLFYQGGLQDFMNAVRQGNQQYSFKSPDKTKDVQEALNKYSAPSEDVINTRDRLNAINAPTADQQTYNAYREYMKQLGIETSDLENDVVAMLDQVIGGNVGKLGMSKKEKEQARELAAYNQQKLNQYLLDLATWKYTQKGDKPKWQTGKYSTIKKGKPGGGSHFNK